MYHLAPPSGIALHRHKRAKYFFFFAQLTQPLSLTDIHNGLFQGLAVLSAVVAAGLYYACSTVEGACGSVVAVDDSWRARKSIFDRKECSSGPHTHTPPPPVSISTLHRESALSPLSFVSPAFIAVLAMRSLAPEQSRLGSAQLHILAAGDEPPRATVDTDDSR